MYQPLDKDIVREMWVEGNLKDQLGLKHRRARRNRSTSESPLESAPMFHDPHNRSLSELENARYPFDSTGHSSPESDVPAKMVYPPMSETRITTSAKAAEYVTADHDQVNVQHLVAPQSEHPITSPVSYYSVSDLPPTSPLPSPKYKMSEGNATPAAIWQQSSATSISRGTPSSPMPTTPLPSHPGPTTLLVPSFGTSTPYDSSSHEMRVRTPSQYESRTTSPGHPPSTWTHDPGHAQRTPSQVSFTSNGSFATANDDFLSDDDRGTINTTDYQLQHGQRLVSHVAEDDQSTLTGHGNTSEVTTWEGARAL